MLTYIMSVLIVVLAVVVVWLALKKGQTAQQQQPAAPPANPPPANTTQTASQGWWGKWGKWVAVAIVAVVVCYIVVFMLANWGNLVANVQASRALLEEGNAYAARTATATEKVVVESARGADASEKTASAVDNLALAVEVGFDSVRKDMGELKAEVASMKGETFTVKPVREPKVAKTYGARRALTPEETGYLSTVLQMRADIVRAKSLVPKFDGDWEKLNREQEAALNFTQLSLDNAKQASEAEKTLDKDFVSFVAELSDSEIRDWASGRPCRTCAERKLERCEKGTHLPTMEAKEIPPKAPTGAKVETQKPSSPEPVAAVSDPTIVMIPGWKSAYDMPAQYGEQTTANVTTNSSMSVVTFHRNVRINTETGMFYDKYYLVEQRSAGGNVFVHHIFVREGGKAPVFVVQTVQPNGQQTSQVELRELDRAMAVAIETYHNNRR